MSTYLNERSTVRIPDPATPSCVPVTRKQLAEPQVARAGAEMPPRPARIPATMKGDRAESRPRRRNLERNTAVPPERVRQRAPEVVLRRTLDDPADERAIPGPAGSEARSGRTIRRENCRLEEAGRGTPGRGAGASGGRDLEDLDADRRLAEGGRPRRIARRLAIAGPLDAAGRGARLRRAAAFRGAHRAAARGGRSRRGQGARAGRRQRQQDDPRDERSGGGQANPHDVKTLPRRADALQRLHA